MVPTAKAMLRAGTIRRVRQTMLATNQLRKGDPVLTAEDPRLAVVTARGVDGGSVLRDERGGFRSDLTVMRLAHEAPELIAGVAVIAAARSSG